MRTNLIVKLHFLVSTKLYECPSLYERRVQGKGAFNRLQKKTVLLLNGLFICLFLITYVDCFEDFPPGSYIQYSWLVRQVTLRPPTSSPFLLLSHFVFRTYSWILLYTCTSSVHRSLSSPGIWNSCHCVLSISGRCCVKIRLRVGKRWIHWRGREYEGQKTSFTWFPRPYSRGVYFLFKPLYDLTTVPSIHFRTFYLSLLGPGKGVESRDPTVVVPNVRTSGGVVPGSSSLSS